MLETGSYCEECSLYEIFWISVSNITFYFTVPLSFIWLPSLVTFYMWQFSRVFILFPFLITCKISMMFFMGAMKCPFSIRCANFDFPFILKSRKCSWNLVWIGVPVCSLYFLLQFWHVSWLTPHLLYFLKLVFLLWVKSFPIVLSTLKDIFRSKFSDSLVMNFVCRPTYVNLAHFVFVLTSLCVLYQLCRWFYLESLHLIYYYVIFSLLCRTLFSYLFH
jgi:hypothetical protein